VLDGRNLSNDMSIERIAAKVRLVCLTLASKDGAMDVDAVRRRTKSWALCLFLVKRVLFAVANALVD
jgi:hypothetical protein